MRVLGPETRDEDAGGQDQGGTLGVDLPVDTSGQQSAMPCLEHKQKTAHTCRKSLYDPLGPNNTVPEWLGFGCA